MKSKILTNSNKDVKEKNLDFYPLRRKNPCFRAGRMSIGEKGDSPTMDVCWNVWIN